MEKVSIYNYLDYRTYASELLKSRKTWDKNYTQSKVAERLRVRPPYFSKVLGLEAHLSEDQLHLFKQIFPLSPSEENYLHLLFSYKRTGIKERSDALLKKIERVQFEQRRTTKNIQSKTVETPIKDLEDYYLDPINIIIHLYFSIPYYRKRPDLIAQKLSVAFDQVLKAQKLLEKLEILKWTGDQWEYFPQKLHLVKESKIFKAHQLLFRQLVVEDFRKYERKVGKNVFITFSSNNDSLKKIEKAFLDFLKKFDKILDDSNGKENEVYQLSFDLFPWGKEKS